jgi:hypothetical protein
MGIQEDGGVLTCVKPAVELGLMTRTVISWADMVAWGICIVGVE